MAWTNPKTWGSAILSSAELNTHLRDNLLETAVAKVTTAGDLVYAAGANALARLAIGSNGALLHVASGLPAWLAPGTDGKILRSAGGAPTWSELDYGAAALSADVAMAGGSGNGPSITLAAGIWRVSTTLTLRNGSGMAGDVHVRIWDGTNTYASTEHTVPVGESASIGLTERRVVLTGTTVLTARVLCSTTNLTIKAATPSNSGGNNASFLEAVRTG